MSVEIKKSRERSERIINKTYFSNSIGELSRDVLVSSSCLLGVGASASRKQASAKKDARHKRNGDFCAGQGKCLLLDSEKMRGWGKGTRRGVEFKGIRRND